MIIPILADFKGYYLILFLFSSISLICSVSWNLFEQNSLNEIHISKMTEWNDVEYPSTPSLAMCRAVRNISLPFWFLKAKLGKMQSKPLILTVSVTILLLSILFLYSKTPRRPLPFFFSVIFYSPLAEVGGKMPENHLGNVTVHHLLGRHPTKYLVTNQEIISTKINFLLSVHDEMEIRYFG